MTDEIAVKFIRLADGTLIDPVTRVPLNTVVSPPSDSVRDTDEVEEDMDGDDETDNGDDDGDDGPPSLDFRPLERRSIHDLTLDRHQMAFLNNVLVYTLWGLPLDEIAIQCGCTMQQVEVVRDMDEYKRMHGYLIDGLREAYMATTQGVLADASHRAAIGVVKKMKHKAADIQLVAMKDILDRTGHRPADRVEHTHNIGNGSELIIRVLKDSDRHTIPTLDITPNA